MTSGGYSEFIVGFITGRVTAQGVLDPANQFSAGTTYTFGLGLGSNYNVTFSGVLMRVSISTNVQGAAEFDIEARTNGSWNTTFAV